MCIRDRYQGSHTTGCHKSWRWANDEAASWPNKRVRPFLLTDRGWFAVACIYGIVVGKGIKLRADAIDQIGVVAIRKIGPADTALKQHVAPDDVAFGVVDVGNVARCMT